MSELLRPHLSSASPRAGLLLKITTRKVTKKSTRADLEAHRPSTQPLDSENVVAGLTEQQGAVARLVAEGLTNPEIAERLHLSPHTVRNYLSRVMARLGVRNRTAVAVILTQLQTQRPAPMLTAEGKRAPLPPAHKGRAKRFAPTLRPSEPTPP